MQEANNLHSVNSYILSTTMSEFFMPKFPESWDYIKNLTNFLR